MTGQQSSTDGFRPSTGAILAGGVLVGAALLFTASTSNASPDRAGATPRDLPEEIVLDAVIRDFRPKGAEGGHPDFQAYAGTTTVGLVADQLDDRGLPVAASLRGQEIRAEYRDADGRPINPALFDPEAGDAMGELRTGGSGNGFFSEESFSQWYRDIMGVNASTVIPLTLRRQGDSNRYIFDSATDAPYVSIGGFFPIDGELYGDYASTGHNFHFTTEIRTQFVYRADDEQVFKFTGDDDVWVFIDGRLVIDLGGLHSRKEQFLDLNRLDWLEDGRTYELSIFHAERRTTQSNFRIETTLNLRRVELPPTSALYD
ncbi:MAG: fibro-slime domain-containing protein [Phycisphaerales bacterium JB059]